MKKTIQSLDVPTVFFLLFTTLLGLFTLQLFNPYINIIIISLVVVQIFHPFYQFIYRKTKNKSLSSFLSVLLTLISVIIPFVVILLLTINEIRNLSVSGNFIEIIGNLEESINNTITNINSGILKSSGFAISQLELRSLLLSFASDLRNQLVPLASQILSLSGGLLFNLFLFILSLSYLFPLFSELPRLFSLISPLNKKIDKIIFDKLRETTRGVIKGTLGVAIIQATSVLIPMVLMGVGAPILLWIVMVLLSIIPVGSGLVWAPVGIAIILGGISSANASQVILGILFIVYSAIIINIIDTTFRPRLMKGATNVHPLATIFSVLGGISVFGILGILYGPVILILFVTLMKIYNSNFTKRDEDSTEIKTA